MKLTLKNYYTDENTYLSNSKLGDYLLSPYYFYRKHVLKEIDRKVTNAMVIGSAVDYLLAQEGEKPKYRVVERRNLKNPPKDYVEVNQAQYDEIVEVANAISSTEVFQDIDKNFKKQIILQVDNPVGDLFSGLCGIPDYLKIDYDKAIIVDLKTSATVQPRKYCYHCLDFGYFRQQAYYQMLLQEITGIKDFISYHLVGDKVKDVYNVALFRLDQEEIDIEKVHIMKLLKEIAERKDWRRPDLKWLDAVDIKIN